MTDLILGQICRSTGFKPGKMTFNLANAHVYYEDMEYQEEFTIDFGD
jgi:thymidylate synthase